MKDKLLGHMVRVKKPEVEFEEKCGEVVCVVREGRTKEYIVQFSNCWSYYRAKKLKIDE